LNADQRPPAADPVEALAADMVHVIIRLSDELAALRAEHAELRAGYLDLIAAGRATLKAANDGEPFALAFLADELVSQHGQADLAPLAWGAQ